MTPRQHKKFLREEAERLKQLSEWWHVPLLSRKRWSLKTGLDTMREFNLVPDDVPLIIKLVENPKYKFSKLFSGAVSLFSHDCIHLLLGRGLLLKDEAFVIGYTMGSAKKMKRWRRNLFMFFAKYLYPKEYRFGEEERFVFNMGVQLGSLCWADLTTFDFKGSLNNNINKLRNGLGIDKKLLERYYCIERECFAKSPESQRLMDTKVAQSAGR